MSLSRLFARMDREALERARGRIFGAGGHWRLVREDKQHEGKDDLDFNHPSKDFLGRPMILVSMRTSWCRNYEMYQDDYAIMSNDGRKGSMSIPARVCRKCPFYRSAKQTGYRYATCAHRAKDNPEVAAAQEVVGMFTSAVDTANKIMGK